MSYSQETWQDILFRAIVAMAAAFSGGYIVGAHGQIVESVLLVLLSAWLLVRVFTWIWERCK